MLFAFNSTTTFSANLLREKFSWFNILSSQLLCGRGIFFISCKQQKTRALFCKLNFYLFACICNRRWLYNINEKKKLPEVKTVGFSRRKLKTLFTVSRRSNIGPNLSVHNILYTFVYYLLFLPQQNIAKLRQSTFMMFILSNFRCKLKENWQWVSLAKI